MTEPTSPPPPHEIPTADIWISEARQRQILDTLDLRESMEQVGQLSSIVVTPEPGPNGEPYKLLAGARRLTAARELGWLFIRAHMLHDLDPITQQVVELHENIKRRNLTWQEEATAIGKLYVLRTKQGETSINRIAEEIGVSHMHFRRALTVVPFILESSPQYDARIANADTVSAAATVVERRDKARKLTTTSQLIKVANEQEEELADVPATIINADFTEWCQSYSGQPFNFIHCDFPYGINFEGAKTARVPGSHQRLYADSPDVFWQLVRALCEATPRIAAPIAHLLFWLDMRNYSAVIEAIEAHTDFELVTPNPIIWGRSDNSGIVSDAARRPRHIYEAALLFSRGDRPVFTTINDCVWSPALRFDREHRSEKPEPVLRQIFPAFVEPGVRVLDPTCGSGSAIVVAEELGAFALGLEIDSESAAAANARVVSRRALNELNKRNS